MESSLVLELKCSLDQFTRHNFPSSVPCAKGRDKTGLSWHLSTSAGPASVRHICLRPCQKPGSALGMGLHHLKYFTWGMLAIKWLWRPPCKQDQRSPSTPCEAEAFAAAAGACPSLSTPRGSSAAPSVSLQGSAGCEALRQC